MASKRLSRTGLVPAVLLSLILASCSDSTGEVGETQPTATESTATQPAATQPATETTVHSHDTAEVREWDGLGPADVIVEVTGDAASGWAVAIEVPQFTFTLAEALVPGEGHGHLMVDGQLQTMIFEPQAFIAELSPGTHEIAVFLAANDHIDYVIGEEQVGGSVTIEVAGEVEAADVVIEVTFQGGEVLVENSRVEASVGDIVEIRITSDVDEEVHVHGYDIMADVTAGAATEMRFEADVPGIWEVELEHAGTPLFELVVS